MAQGIYIDLNDGRNPMMITSGMRGLSFAGNFNVSSGGFTKTFPITGSDGSSKFLLPRNGAYSFELDRGVEIYYINGFSATNTQGTITIGGENAYNDRITQFSGTVVEVLRASTGQGIYVADSTDFASITTRDRLLTCKFSATVSFTNSYTMPIAGIPFGKWNNSGVSVEFDGDRTLYCTNINTEDTGDTPGSVTLDLIIFQQVAPTPGPGINIFNSNNQCTFSTLTRPLVVSGFRTLTSSNQSIGNSYFPILRCGFNTRAIPAYKELRNKGVVMSGGNVRSGTGTRIVRYEIGNRPDVTLGIPLPYLPDMY
ncbi:hypothetical protein bas01_0028 [Escherichia phage AugustePiccard]|uniref:Uncharacterized protein n=1 Tax=Escherichia phage AugustePiccard TaxID=2851954 RepID=A0AAE7VP09_9CAUD|nr:hypothetical protein bas01_0028 [Escherichia phage AugustePiccard]